MGAMGMLPRRFLQSCELLHPSSGTAWMAPSPGTTWDRSPRMSLTPHLGAGTPISSSWTLILVLCLHPMPPQPPKFAYVHLLIRILPLSRGSWNCPSYLCRQILNPGPASHTCPQPTCPILTPWVLSFLVPYKYWATAKEDSVVAYVLLQNNC